MLGVRSMRWWLGVAALMAGCGGQNPQSSEGGAAGGEEGGGGEAGSTSTWFSTVSTGGNDNRAPVANAGVDKVAAPGSVVELDASGSYDPDGGQELTYQWSVWGAFFEGSSEPTATFVAPTYPTTITATVSVDDDWGGTAQDSVDIFVRGFKPELSAGADVSGTAGDTLTMSASATEPDGDPITFTWTQVAGPTVAMTNATTATPSIVLPPGLTEHLVFEVVASDGDGSSDPDWVTAVLLTGPDTDGDLLEDSVEGIYGTSPTSPDTDEDGIPDGWEILGHEFVDYAALGCNPLARDLLVEIDYEPSVKPGDALLAAWADHYASLPIQNPDGSTGIAFRPFLDSHLPDTFSCPAPFDAAGSPPIQNPLWREAFHLLSICEGGYSGAAQIGGRYLGMSVPATNDDPTDDRVEYEVFVAYWLMLHEMGHSLGLFHGGGDPINHKPNYQSYMNYDYHADLLGGPAAIEGATTRLSRGTLAPVDECALVEVGALAGAAPDEIAALATYVHPDGGYVVLEDGSVDWDRDESIETEPYELVVRSSTDEWGSANYPECQLLLDYDDVALIAEKMASTIPSDPALGPPNALRLRAPIVWQP